MVLHYIIVPVRATATRQLRALSLQQYELLSVEPSDDRSFQLACKTLNVDIITFDLSRALPFGSKLALLKKAVARGVYIEMQLAGAPRRTPSCVLPRPLWHHPS